MVMVGLLKNSGRNGVILRIRRIKRYQGILDSLLLLIILGLIIQMDLVIATARSAGLIKLIPTICMKPSRKREQASNFLQLTCVACI